MRPPKTFRAPRAFRGPTPIRNQESKIRNPLTRHSGRCFFLPGRPTARALRRRLGFGLAVPTGRCCFPDVDWQGSMSFSPEASREVCMAQKVLFSRRHRRDGPMLPKGEAGDQEKSGAGQVEILDFRFWIGSFGCWSSSWSAGEATARRKVFGSVVGALRSGVCCLKIWSLPPSVSPCPPRPPSGITHMSRYTAQPLASP